MRTFASNVPAAVLALVVAVVIAILAAPVTARRLDTSRPVAMLLLFGFGLVLAATITPHREAFEGIPGPGVCDMSRFGLAPISYYLRPTETSLNVLLFVPLGVAIGLLPRARSSAVVLALAVGLTFLVEVVQLTVTVLSRGCQLGDIIDNLLGLLIGLVIGALARPFVGRLTSRSSA